MCVGGGITFHNDCILILLFPHRHHCVILYWMTLSITMLPRQWSVPYNTLPLTHYGQHYHIKSSLSLLFFLSFISLSLSHAYSHSLHQFQSYRARRFNTVTVAGMGPYVEVVQRKVIFMIASVLI